MDNVTLIRITSVIFVVVFLPLYFLPTIIGWKKSRSLSIFLLNFFLGWTMVGWIVALVLALKKDTPVFCNNCGKSLLPGSQLCPSCGRSLSASPAI